MRLLIFWIALERGRSGRKRRDFFGTIKRRLGRSKTRSRSAGPDGDENHDDAHSRSISADRARDPGSGDKKRTIFQEILESFNLIVSSKINFVIYKVDFCIFEWFNFLFVQLCWYFNFN